MFFYTLSLNKCIYEQIYETETSTTDKLSKAVNVSNQLQ